MSTITSTPGPETAGPRRTVDVRAVPLPDGAAFAYDPGRRVLLVNSTADAADVEEALAAYVEWMRPAAAG